jgi:hypothetical protein
LVVNTTPEFDEYLPVAFRGWTGKRKETKSGKASKDKIDRLIILDTETTPDVMQRFRFGFYRETLLRGYGKYDTKREGIVYADDFQATEPKYYSAVMRYAKLHRIPVISQAEFSLEFLRGACYNGHKYTALVGFNLPFDLSRIAYDVTESRALKNGFTFRMFPKRPACPDDCHQVHKIHRPQLCKMVVMDFDASGNPVYACETVLKNLGNPLHDCVLPPCKTDCQSEHHTSKCLKACKDHTDPLDHSAACKRKCGKHHPHIPAYCAVDCGKHEDKTQCHRPPCPIPHGDCKEEHKHQKVPYYSDYDPTLRIKHLDSKKAFIRWGVPAQSGPQKRNIQGQFIDLRQLIFGMTNRGVSLASACKLYNLPEEYSKTHAENYEVIDREFIEYARQDVKATEALAVAVLGEYNKRHYPATGLPATRVYSPATIGKSYLGAMGITPMLERGEESAPNDEHILGICTSTFYGARSEVHIRRHPLPVTVCDFTNMYGSVNMLMELWKYQTAANIEIDDSLKELSRFSALAADVAKNGPDILLEQSTWPGIIGFAQIIPDGDILPVRARYKKDSFNVGHNIFYSSQPVWYTYPDILASALLTGKTPNIRKVMSFKVASGQKLAGLKPLVFGGVTRINPESQDLFRSMIEERAVIKAGLKKEYSIEGDRNQEFLKVGVNAPSYGIFVEMQASEDEETEELDVFGQFNESWKCTPVTIELAGQYCYPPIGAVITGAARLMLSITEKLVYDVGGNWMFGDTDSMALITTATGGLIPCPGGDHTTADGQKAVKALSRVEVKRIRDTMNRLNPYDMSKVPELLKDETEDSNRSGQVYGFAISAKRYCLFFYDEDGRAVIPADLFNEDGTFKQAATIDGKSNGKSAYMQHGLGLYLNPADLNWEMQPKGLDNGHWMREVWQWILDRAHGLDPEYPSWVGRPALTRYAVTNPAYLRCFNGWNDGKGYPERVNPFNFLLTASEVGSGGRYYTEEEHETGEMDAQRQRKPRRLIAPYSRNPDEWVNGAWYDLRKPDAPPVHITTTELTLNGDLDGDGRVLIKDHQAVLDEYEHHVEIKSAMPNGVPCGKYYSGVLARRVVRVSEIQHIGKEANRLEEVDVGLIGIEDDVLITYNRADRELVRAAYEGASDREIARLVTKESDTLRRLCLVKYCGIPIDGIMSHKTVARYFRGAKLQDPNAENAIIRTVAKTIGPRIGVAEMDIGIEGDYVSPQKVLTLWQEKGYPKATPMPIKTNGLRVKAVKKVGVGT